MTDHLKNFLSRDDVKEFIRDKKWIEVYSYLYELTMELDNSDLYSEFLALMYDCGIDIFDQLKNRLPNQMFYGWSKDSRFDVINIPEGIEEIGAEAFCMSETIEQIYLPTTLKYIGFGAFAYSDIKEIHYPGTREEWDKIKLGGSIFEDHQQPLKLYIDGNKSVINL